MNCPACGHAIREGAKFCDECGGAVQAACPQCQTELRPTAKFCDSCGYRVGEPAPISATSSPGAPAATSSPPAASVTTTMPSTFADERYQVKEFLGEGGRKKVYLARDTRLDRDVALALIKTEGLDADGRVRVRREAQAMGRLGDHGHIVTVYDVGEHDGRLFIVCQYMPGGDLESVLQDAPDQRLPIPEAVRIADEVAQGLEHAHDKEIIHRDLKPGNIWLTEGKAVARSAEMGRRSSHRDGAGSRAGLGYNPGPGGSKTAVAPQAGEPVAPQARRRIPGQADTGSGTSGSATRIGTAKLGDFGLAVALDRSRITREGMMVGTAAYLPPEQAVGGGVDARSDLYALGCVLYEMVCGRPPFQGDDAVTVISQHLNTSPIAPTWHNSAVPPQLEALILDLLAKAPDDRPASARAVRTRLGSMDLELVPATPAAPQQMQQAAQGGARAAWGQFVGRTKELGQLKAGVDEAMGGKGSTLMLVGEPGIGKTRTSEELATYAKMRGAQVLLGRCYEGEGAPAFWPWVQIIRDHVYTREPDALRSEMGSGAPVIAQMVSEVGDRLPGLPAPPELEPDQARFRLFDSVTSFLRNAGRQQPVVLILDDLHWADKPSLLLLQFLAQTMRDMRVLVLGTYRDVELDRKHPLAEVLSDLRRERLYERVLLRGFTVEEVTELLESMAQQDIGGAGRNLAQAIHRETEGNPFFVQEIILHLGESGAIYRDDQGQWIMRGSSVEELGIPEGVREVIGRRLSRLTDRCNDLLSVGAVIGRDFDQRILEFVSGIGGEDMLNGLEEALTAGLITEDTTHPGSYRFSHALIRETLYGELSTPRRVRFHRQIGEVTESLHMDNLDPQLATLAYHFAEGAQAGGDVDRAIDYAVRAAERATAQVAFEEAVAQYERALQAFELKQPPDEHRRIEVMLDLGQAYWSAGMPEAARANCADAAGRARERGDAEQFARAALGFEWRGGVFGRPDEEGIALFEEALELLPDSPSPLRACVNASLAWCILFGLDYTQRERGLALCHQGFAMAQDLDDREAIRHTHYRQHMAIWGPGTAKERAVLAAEMVDMAHEDGDAAVQAIGLIYQANALLETGDLEGAERAMARRGILVQESYRTPGGFWQQGLWKTFRLQMAGKFDEAEQAALEAFEYGRQVVPENALQYLQATTGSNLSMRGRWAAPDDDVNATIREYMDVPAYATMWGRICLRAGDSAPGREVLDRLTADDFAQVPTDLAWTVTMSALVLLSTELEGAPHAAQLYDAIHPYAGRAGVCGLIAVYGGSINGWLGRLACALERWDDAEAHLQAAIEMDERLGARHHVAYEQLCYAQTLLGRDATGDRTRALELANAALVTAQELGLDEALQDALEAKLKAQGVDLSDISSSIHAVVATVQLKQAEITAHAGTDGTVTLMFSDMKGFTEMTERLGDVAAHQVVKQHNAIVRHNIAKHRGEELELQGDGFLLAFSDPSRALRCASDIQRDFRSYNEAKGDAVARSAERDTGSGGSKTAVAPEDGEPVAPEARRRIPGQADTGSGMPGSAAPKSGPKQSIHVRIGLHTGEAIRDADKFFGKTVILASRIANEADGDEILVSTDTKDATEGHDDFLFDAGRDFSLKGLIDAYRLHLVDWQTG